MDIHLKCAYCSTLIASDLHGDKCEYSTIQLRQISKDKIPIQCPKCGMNNLVDIECDELEQEEYARLTKADLSTPGFKLLIEHGGRIFGICKTSCHDGCDYAWVEIVNGVQKMIGSVLSNSPLNNHG